MWKWQILQKKYILLYVVQIITLLTSIHYNDRFCGGKNNQTFRGTELGHVPDIRKIPQDRSEEVLVRENFCSITQLWQQSRLAHSFIWLRFRKIWPTQTRAQSNFTSIFSFSNDTTFKFVNEDQWGEGLRGTLLVFVDIVVMVGSWLW